MKDIRERLIAEKAELNAKMEAIEALVANREEYDKLPADQMTLLNVQRYAMQTYSQCLLERIVRLSVD